MGTRKYFVLLCCVVGIACSKIALFPDKTPPDADNDVIADTDIDNDVLDVVGEDGPEDIIPDESPCDGVVARIDNLRVTETMDNSRAPSLTWTGSRFGIGWHDDRDANWEIYFGQVDSAGSRVGADVRVTDDPRDDLTASVAWTESEYGLTWHSNTGGWNVFFIRMTAAGSVSGTEVQITDDPAYSWTAPILWADSQYGVVWYDQRDGNPEIYFSRITGSGSEVGADIRITSEGHGSSFPSFAWTGSEFGVSWIEHRDGNAEIYVTRISPIGDKLDSDVRITSDPALSQFPSMQWTGSEYGVCWRDDRDGDSEVYFARLTAALEIVGSEVRITNDSAASDYPSLSWTGSEFGVAWHDGRDGNLEVYFARILATGIKDGEDLRISTVGDVSKSPSLVWTGSEFGIAWQDSRDGNDEIYMSIVAYDCS